MISRTGLKRLATREYIPLLGSVLFWFLVAMAIGLPDAVRMLAALTFLRSVQLFTRMPTLKALRRRQKASSTVIRASVRRALQMQLYSFLATIFVLFLLLALLWSAGQSGIVVLILLMAVGQPVRNLLQAYRDCNFRMYRMSLHWFGAGLALLAYWRGWGALEIAFLIGLREWLAAVLTIIVKPDPRSKSKLGLGPITAREVGQITALRARRAFVYLLSKAVIGIAIPGASLITRTGRGLKVHHRLEGMMPRNLPGFYVLAFGPFSVAAAIVFLAPQPALLLVAALLTRVAAAAGSVLIWSPYLPPLSEPDDDDEEDD